MPLRPILFFLPPLLSAFQTLTVLAQETRLQEPSVRLLTLPVLEEPKAPLKRTAALPASPRDPNQAVLEAINTMPAGGRYAASAAAFSGLGRAVTVGSEGLRVEPEFAQPSFCSGATYLVFLKALEALKQQGAVTLERGTEVSLLVAHQRDGQGIWGRWNANGPGTARLFTELHLGHNFGDFAAARSGDFMKIFWTEEIGQREHGHSVVFLGTNLVGGKEYVRFWSSNIPSGAGDLSGYGEKMVPRTKIARAIFSRLENPGNIAHATQIAATDGFLAGLLARRTTIEEVRKQCEF